MPFDFLISALVTLLVVVDPIGLVPSFLALTGNLSEDKRRQVALRACLIAHAARDAEQAVVEHARDLAAFPLAIPLMAGPGAITATILLAGQADYRPQWLAILLGVVVAVMGACLLSFFAAAPIGRLLGITGNVVASRLLGVILAALAVQYVVDGARAAFGF